MILTLDLFPSAQESQHMLRDGWFSFVHLLTCYIPGKPGLQLQREDRSHLRTSAESEP